MKSPEAILIRPILTEKVLNMQEKAGKYAFRVVGHSNKIEIKKAVEAKFEVLVDKVHTINVKGKTKRMNTRKGLTRGKRSGWKKAVITLKEGYSIDFFQDMQG